MKIYFLAFALSFLLFSCRSGNNGISGVEGVSAFPNEPDKLLFYHYSPPEKLEWTEELLKGDSRENTGMNVFNSASEKFIILKKKVKEQFPEQELKIYLSPEAGSIKSGGEESIFISIHDVPVIQLIRYMCRDMNLKTKMKDDTIYIDIMTPEEIKVGKDKYK